MYEYLDQEGLDLYDGLLKTDLSALKSQISESGSCIITAVTSDGGHSILNASGGIQNSTDNRYNIFYLEVNAGTTYTINHQDVSGDLVCAFFTAPPQVGSISYNGNRIVQNSKTIVSPINGFLAFRSNGTVVSQSASFINGFDPVARKELVGVESELNINPFIHYIKSSDYAFGYMENGKALTTSARAYTPNFMKVNPGDLITIQKTSVYVFAVAFYTSPNESDFVSQNLYNTNEIVVPTGVSYARVVCRNTETDTITLEEFDDIISIHKAFAYNQAPILGCFTRYEQTKPNDFIHGYLDANGAIQSHSNYIVSPKYYKVNKGDIVRCNYTGIIFQVVNYNSSLVKVGGTTEWLMKQNTNPYSAGEYIVQNDGYIRPQMSLYDTSTVTDINTYGDGIIIIHRVPEKNNRDALRDIKWITPTNNVRARKIRENQDRNAQGGVVINGYLWQSTDDYGGSTAIEKINIETGASVKFLTHNLGHMNSLDYNEKTDTLLTSNGANLLLIENFSVIAEGATIQSSDVITIPTDKADMSWCFGEDEYTVYAVSGNKTTGTITNTIYKYELGFSTNDLSGSGVGTYVASSSYNGTALLLKTYTGEYREDADGRFYGNSAGYAQDVKYDGYLYLAYGTAGFNVFVIDVNDSTGEFYAVGNYQWEYRDTDYSVIKCETETCAINGNKLIVTYRNYTANKSVMVEFER